MKGYLYHLTNQINGKKYIGKTINLQHRIQDHFSKLKNNKHHSHKLQRAINKYGLENFVLTFQEIECEDENALSLLEIQEIKKFNSYYEGYNETLGGDGNRLNLQFDECVLIYNITQNYKGVNRKIAKFFNCDHTVIDNISKNQLYKNIEFKQEKYLELIKKIGLENCNKIENYNAHNEKKLNEEKCFAILSICLQESGYDKTLCEIFEVDSKCIYRLKKGLIYKEYIKKFNKLSEEDKNKIKEETFIRYNVDKIKAKRQRNGLKNSLTQTQINYILDNEKDKTRTAIAKELGISVDRVSGVVNRKTYKDLIDNYYSSKQTNCHV